jgi:hypothetical protein
MYWISHFAFLVDFTAHLNLLNTKLQNRNLLITESFDLICAFETKLRLWSLQLKNGVFEHFEHLNKIIKEIKELDISKIEIFKQKY